MTIRDLKGKVNDRIPVENVLVSVFDKSGLGKLVPRLIDINPNVRFMSTGGTYGKIKEILGNSYGNNLIEIAEYTGFPEMEGGLVKTLHPKIHAGLLGERNNPEHQRYLREELNGGVFIDMAVVNLYPFSQVVSEEGTTFEQARGNIDIGGPTMIRAAAKNFPSCAVACEPFQYEKIMEVIRNNNGSTTFDLRLQLAREAFGTTAGYENSIVGYLSISLVNPEKVKAEYNFTKE
jgi:phosphoribosylaminoimidazolecarboxamide formyltransferase/IMP cyclohydrolase